MGASGGHDGEGRVYSACRNDQGQVQLYLVIGYNVFIRWGYTVFVGLGYNVFMKKGYNVVDMVGYIVVTSYINVVCASVLHSLPSTPNQINAIQVYLALSFPISARHTAHLDWDRKVHIRLPGKGNSNSHGPRPVNSNPLD